MTASNASIFLENEDKVLFIHGINIDKINNDLHGNDTLYVENNVFDYNDEINNDFDKITKKYINYELWECNNINCWYCTLNFTNKPIFIPQTIQKEYLEVCGNFCSFGCATKYINIYFKHDDKKRCQYINHLKYLYSDIYKEDAKIIIESPDKETIDKFGGHYSSEEYKKQIKI